MRYYTMSGIDPRASLPQGVRAALRIEGRRAFELGLTWGECPYPPAYMRHRSEWRTGYRHAAEKAGLIMRKHQEARISAAEYYRRKRDDEDKNAA
jgi:hypothetical protein